MLGRLPLYRSLNISYCNAIYLKIQFFLSGTQLPLEDLKDYYYICTIN